MKKVTGTLPPRTGEIYTFDKKLKQQNNHITFSDTISDYDT